MYFSDLKNKYPKLSKGQKVGAITNYLTEQLISNGIDIISIHPDKYESIIKNHNIKIIFIENKIYEADHPWFEKSYKYIVSEKDLLNIEIVVISKKGEEIQETLKGFPQITIDENSKDVSVQNGEIHVPVIVKEKEFNPANSSEKYDIVYFKIGEMDHSDEFVEFHSKFNLKIKNIVTDKLSREFIKRFLMVIKDSKLLYIHYSDKIDPEFVRYLEIIATLQNTITFLDPVFNNKFKYAIKFVDVESTINYIRALVNNKMLRDKYIIPRTRQSIIDHTFAGNPLTNEILNLDFKKDPTDDFKADISIITATKRKENLIHLTNEVNLQKHVNLQVVLLTHGFELSTSEKENLRNLAKFELIIISKDETVSFGNCLNECIKHVKYDYVIKIDDDDFYFPNFIIDIYLGIKYSSADLVGKNAFFFYLESENLIGQRRMDNQLKEVREVKGNTLLLETNTLKKYMFNDLSRHVDSDLIIRIREDGGLIYSIHPYDMCVFRGDDKADHTWQVSDSRFLRDADVLYYGNPNETIASN